MKPRTRAGRVRAYQDAPVFPQTETKNKNFNRVGGLTKRELFAAIMFSGTSLVDPALAVKWADDLLKELEKPR